VRSYYLENNSHTSEKAQVEKMVSKNKKFELIEEKMRRKKLASLEKILYHRGNFF